MGQKNRIFLDWVSGVTKWSTRGSNGIPPSPSPPGATNHGLDHWPMRERHARNDSHPDHATLPACPRQYNNAVNASYVHSNATHLKSIRLKLHGSGKANENHGTFSASCARARFAGCGFLRRIILGLNTVIKLELIHNFFTFDILLLDSAFW